MARCDICGNKATKSFVNYDVPFHIDRIGVALLPRVKFTSCAKCGMTSFSDPFHERKLERSLALWLRDRDDLTESEQRFCAFHFDPKWDSAVIRNRINVQYPNWKIQRLKTLAVYVAQPGLLGRLLRRFRRSSS